MGGLHHLKRKQSTGQVGHRPVQVVALDEINRKDAIALLMSMLKLDGVSGREQPVVDFIKRRLGESGIPESWIRTDQAHRRSPLGGQVGNLICRLPGTVRGPRRLLIAHMDTVPLCEGSRPVLRNGCFRSGDPKLAIGADNRSGSALLLLIAMTLRQRRLPHPPLTFFWSVQEETALTGSRFANVQLLGRPRLAFNWDGGRPRDLTIGATGDYQLKILVEGLASHAGGHPEDGISAIAIAARAIADLDQNGWHGLILKGRQRGTSNVGIISGGAATNVVSDRLSLSAEARSHDSSFRRRIVAEYRKAFERAARQVKNKRGRCGRVRFHLDLAYESFELDRTDPVVLEAARSLAKFKIAPRYRIVNGGLDANWLTARGIPTVSLGCGQRRAHTVKEYLVADEFFQACRIALELAMGGS